MPSSASPLPTSAADALPTTISPASSFSSTSSTEDPPTSSTEWGRAIAARETYAGTSPPLRVWSELTRGYTAAIHAYTEGQWQAARSEIERVAGASPTVRH